jgi:hypothetical protein
MRFYDTTCTLSQQLNNLPKGKYRLSVQGFYRAYGDSYEAFTNGSENITAYLFAGDNATKLRSVYSEGLRWQGTGNWQIHNDQYYPDNSSSANYAFENRLYEGNTLEFEAEGNITIGVSSASDRITASSYKYTTLKVADGQILTDGTDTYTGTLNADKLTAPLLQSVQLNADAYALTADYDFRLDVLADAIQISDSAADERHWTTTAAP